MIDTIAFDIAGNGVQTIQPAAGDFFSITEGVVIDGYTQPGAAPDTLPFDASNRPTASNVSFPWFHRAS